MASDQRSRGHLVRKKRSPRRYTPRDDTGINTFIIDSMKPHPMTSRMNGIMSSERVVNSFKNYFRRAEIDLKEVAELQDEFELEYAMSQIPTNRADWAFDMGMLALEQGQISQAKTRLSEIKSLLPKMNKEEESLYNLIWNLLQGEVLLAQGALDEALDAGKRACGPESPYWKPWQELFWFQACYIDLTARIYAEKGDVGQAISEYERLLKTNFSTGFYFPVDARFHYRLGLLYERADETAKAKAQFKKFLDLWKDADPGIDEVEDAWQRLADLMNR